MISALCTQYKMSHILLIIHHPWCWHLHSWVYKWPVKSRCFPTVPCIKKCNQKCSIIMDFFLIFPSFIRLFNKAKKEAKFEFSFTLSSRLFHCIRISGTVWKLFNLTDHEFMRPYTAYNESLSMIKSKKVFRNGLFYGSLQKAITSEERNISTNTLRQEDSFLHDVITD